MAEATIPVTKDMKQRIDNEKRNGETYNGLLRRLLDGHEDYVTEQRARSIANDQISERVVREAQQ